MQPRSVAVITAAIFAIGFGMVPVGATAETNVLFIFDASGSMKTKVDKADTRLSAAKRVFTDTLNSLPASTRLGLMLYGHRRAKDCTDIEVVSPMGADDAATIAKHVTGIDARGETPIAEALRQGARSFAAFKGQTNRIVLITDGIEECKGDPCAAAQAIKSSGLDLKVDIVGFTLNAAQGKAIECVTKTTGGSYYSAQDAKGLTTALAEVKQEVAQAAPPAPAPTPPPPPPASAPPPKPAEHTYGQPIRGGDAFDNAVALQTGTQYQLNYDQPADRQDFFKIPVKGGQELVATITGGVTNGIQVEFENALRQRISGPVAAGTRGRSMLSYDVAHGGDGTYYVLIESAGYGGHVGPDATFQLALINQFDANTGFDTGSDESAALPIQPGMYPRSNMNDVDTMDVYKFTAEAGKIYQFKTRPTNDAAVMALSALDADGNKLGDAQAQNGGAVATLGNLKLTKPGPIFAKVSFNRSYGNPAGDYSFAFGVGEVASPPRPAPRAP